MKTFLAIICFATTFIPRISSADIFVMLGKDNNGAKIVSTNSITIASNQVLSFTGSPQVFGTVSTFTGSASPQPSYFSYTFIKDSFQITGDFTRPMTFPGPGVLSLNLVSETNSPAPFNGWHNNSGAVIALTSSLQNYPPDKAVVIPAGSPGANIALEASTDLLTWFPAPLGTYTAPTNNLFFRMKMTLAQ
jgi:hypothetical protein